MFEELLNLLNLGNIQFKSDPLLFVANEFVPNEFESYELDSC